MTFLEKILGQSQPGVTPTTLYSVPASTVGIIKTILICNTGASDQTYQIFVDNDGSTYDATTAIHYDVPIAAKETRHLDLFIPFSTAGGTLGVQASSTDVTFTVTGAEIT